MKTPVFWNKPVGFLARALQPVACIYQIAAGLRRIGAQPYKASVPVVCVGNVVAGGAGKTPVALALAALLRGQGRDFAFVTRGYGGCQKGPLRVDFIQYEAKDVGDEAMLLARTAPVIVGRDRAAAIRMAEEDFPLLILDDGLQNPHIAPDLSLLVMDGVVGVGNGRLIPAGPLREPLADALHRVQALVIVGGERTLKPAGLPLDLPVLRAHLQADFPAAFPRGDKFLAFAGIGRPEKFYRLCREQGLNLVATHDFPDHHPFTDAELHLLLEKARSLGARLLTTEKDYVRLSPAIAAQVLTLPVRLVFEDEAAVLKLLQSVTDALR